MKKTKNTNYYEHVKNHQKSYYFIILYAFLGIGLLFIPNVDKRLTGLIGHICHILLWDISYK